LKSERGNVELRSWMGKGRGRLNILENWR
jgi:hypothetical protein